MSPLPAVSGHEGFRVRAGFIPARFAAREEREGINASPTCKFGQSEMNVVLRLQLPAASRYFDAVRAPGEGPIFKRPLLPENFCA